MEFHIISNRGDKTTLCIDDEMTVGDVRGVAAAMLDAPEDRVMTMSLGGKLLTDDAEAWVDLCARLFRSQQPAPMQRKIFCNLTDKPVTEMQSGEVMRMFGSKEERKLEMEKERQSTEAMESMVESLSQNPALLESILRLNPQIEKMQKKSPEMARMLKDPEMLKTILMSSVNPERRKEMERSAELQLAQISAMPGGQQAINHFMDQMNADGGEEETENERAIRIGTSAPADTNDRVYTPDPTKEANNDPLPNPWAAAGVGASAAAAGAAANPYGAMGGGGMTPGNPFGFFPPAAPNATAAGPSSSPSFPSLPFGSQDPATMQAVWMMMMQSMSNTNGAAPAATASPSQAVQVESADPEAQASAEPVSVVSEETIQAGLAALREMGFEDEAMCREALQATGGDVEAAVDYIADHESEK
ncbi:hypothetical protein ABB37_04286 [Leptomonas pyrrhocoris]|uniref:UBA domain-containing protein n=1 Tax=Leptomonas pyrrhocoris TaxID=157538 RepID=A0A0N0VFD1_LEPPY|nr:hypothetical protein ABB37_04286 [Leptomonas pyrrhocoris]KPA80874.1 hypothetical protein ABB37_04286 [Leptomonas pyrrhocoris]|eukprot:XP_015659313.1 hypothetical protein ABB37_04286 [Leptomonas pyrrhocoris]